MPTITEQDVMSALKSCYDPEIPVNIVDLGLIYKVDFVPRARPESRGTEAGRHSGNDFGPRKVARACQHQRPGKITRRAIARRE